MNYSQLFPQDDITIPIPNPTQHPSAPVQMLRRESYNTMNDGMNGPTGGAANHSQGQLVSPLEDVEEMDTSSRPRLTQEQIAILEDQFKGKPKPGTDFKKVLAAQIGLSLQRVNNWYQNRRAKARHQRPQERRFDVLPHDPADPGAPWGASTMAFPDFHPGQEQFCDVNSLSHQVSSSGFLSIPNDDLTELSKPYSPDLDMIHAALESNRTAGGANVNDHCTKNASKADSQFSPLANHASDLKSSFSLMPEWDINNWITDPQADVSMHQNDGFVAMQDSLHSYSHAMYQNSVEGLSVGNPSCQTFGTNSSSDGEPGLMTPPAPKTSPMPTLASDCQLRRGSNSSELAIDLNTIPLHQTRSRPSLYEEMFCTPATSEIVPSADQPSMVPQMIATGSPGSTGPSATPSRISAVPLVDLASRRKRPRPATLRPDAQRSQSYAGPLTMSPNSKVSSQGLGLSPSVRRIKSTGQNMNVVSGRIQKSGLASAQMSPRNFQTYLDAAGLSSSQIPHRNSTETSQTSAPNFTPLTPLSPAKMELQPKVWPNYSPYINPTTSNWDQSHDHATNNAFETGNNVTSPPITPFNIDAFPRFFVERPLQDTMYHCPPQSAPPQQTHFFGDSPPMPATNNIQPGWLVPSSTMPLEEYRDDSPMSMRRPSQLSQMGFPESQFQFVGNHSQGLPSMGLGPSTIFGNTPPPHKDLEFQVTMIPKPQGAPHARKKYEFNHTTPKDFSQSIHT